MSEVLIEKPKLPGVLRRLMTEIDITEAELARKTRIPQPTLHRILSGATRSPRGESLSPLAKFFSISISQLIGDEPLPEDRIPGTHNPEVVAWTSIPVLTWEIAGQWPDCKNRLKEQHWNDWITTDKPVSNDAFALRVTGESMAPRFNEGTTLVIEPTAEARNRSFIVVQFEDQSDVTFKQLLIDGGDQYLKPINPEFKTTLLDKPHRVLGVVIQTREDLD